MEKNFGFSSRIKPPANVESPHKFPGSAANKSRPDPLPLVRRVAMLESQHRQNVIFRFFAGTSVLPLASLPPRDFLFPRRFFPPHRVFVVLSQTPRCQTQALVFPLRFVFHATAFSCHVSLSFLPFFLFSHFSPLSHTHTHTFSVLHFLAYSVFIFS